MADYQQLTHKFEPVYNQESKILILGTFPSVKSREGGFYYGHPQNRFWKVLASVAGEPIPGSIPEKKQFLLCRQIAVWDVIQSCEILGSSDSSIRNVVPADIPGLLNHAPIQAIFGNGAKACELFQKYTKPMLGQLMGGSMAERYQIRKLPSTSPANAAWNLERLTKCWKEGLEPFL